MAEGERYEEAGLARELEILPWHGQYLFSNVPESSNEDWLRQRITRAFEKAIESGVFAGYDESYTFDWWIQELADRLFEKILPHFKH